MSGEASIDTGSVKVSVPMSAEATKPHSFKKDDSWRLPAAVENDKSKKALEENPATKSEASKNDEPRHTILNTSTRIELVRGLYDIRTEIQTLRENGDDVANPSSELKVLMEQNNILVNQLDGLKWNKDTVRGLLDVVAEERLARSEEKAVEEGTVMSQPLQVAAFELSGLSALSRGIEKGKIKDRSVFEDEKRRVEGLISEWKANGFFTNPAVAKRLNTSLAAYGIAGD